LLLGQGPAPKFQVRYIIGSSLGTTTRSRSFSTVAYQTSHWGKWGIPSQAKAVEERGQVKPTAFEHQSETPLRRNKKKKKSKSPSTMKRGGSEQGEKREGGIGELIGYHAESFLFFKKKRSKKEKDRPLNSQTSGQVRKEWGSGGRRGVLEGKYVTAISAYQVWGRTKQDDRDFSPFTSK